MCRLAKTIPLFLLLLALSARGHADLYGFVDEKGVAHFSNVPLDSRYYLFKKEPRTLPPESGAATYRSPEFSAPRVVRVNPFYRKQYGSLVTAVAKEYRLDAALLHAIITVESGYNPRARSPKGAIGIMQLMPDTARRFEVANIWDANENLHGGARYLRYLLELFNNNLSLALAAYNAGELAVMQAGRRIPPFAETRSYVPKVLQHYARYRAAGLS
jgi:soluble lytic murein transglycosylase-like protein